MLVTRVHRQVVHTIIAVLALLATLIATGVETPSPAGASTSSAVVEAESLSLPSWGGQRFSDAGASGGEGLLIWTNATASGAVTSDRWASELVVSARADLCDGPARMEMAIDGEPVGAVDVASGTWEAYRFPVEMGSGEHQIAVRFTNDTKTSSCDRNLRVDWVELRQRSSTNPLAARPFHVSPGAAAEAADQIRDDRPRDAERLDLLAETPTARWFGDWTADVRAEADSYVTNADRAGAMPMLLTYAIPQRDCGSHSGGGLSPDEYRQWVRNLAAGIGDRPAVVVVEPDAVALVECLNESGRAVRNDLLTDAVTVLAANPEAVVYLDAGHSNWVSADEMADRLRAAGVGRARGVSLNVSNFRATADEVAYAQDLSDRLGVHAVIDTSRNGEGSDGTWCNPFGRAIGTFPTSDTGTKVVDALLWVKVPGESDGTCNGGPPAGEFWIDYAVDLVRSAGY